MIKAFTFRLALALAIVFSFNGCVKDKADNFDSKIIVHRGLQDEHPENTLESFQAAFDYGFEYLELDIVFTKDKIPVVFHDLTLDRMTDINGNVWDYNFSELDSILIDGKYSIPSLDEFLKKYKNSFKQVFVDIKEDASYKSLLQLVEIIDKNNCKDILVITSYYPEIIKDLKEMDSELILGSDNGDIEVAISQSIENDYKYALTWFYEVNSKYKEIAADENINVVVFTPNSTPELKQAINLGVYGIMTDEPFLLRELMNK